MRNQENIEDEMCHLSPAAAGPASQCVRVVPINSESPARIVSVIVGGGKSKAHGLIIVRARRRRYWSGADPGGHELGPSDTSSSTTN